MDNLLVECIVAIVVAILGYIVGIFKDRQYNLKIEGLYARYKLFFDVCGAVIKMVDEKLYIEMEQALAEMKESYESLEFTTQDFNQVVKEWKDVFERAQQIYDNGIEVNG